MKLILSIPLLIFALSIKGQDKNAIKYVDNYINAAFWKILWIISSRSSQKSDWSLQLACDGYKEFHEWVKMGCTYR